MTKVYGMASWTLSPMELRAFKGYGRVTQNVFNRYVIEWIIPYCLPTFTVYYLMYDWAKRANAKSKRKNLKDFEDDNNFK